MRLAYLDNAVGVFRIHHADMAFGRLHLELLREPFISALTGVAPVGSLFANILDQGIEMRVRIRPGLARDIIGRASERLASFGMRSDICAALAKIKILVREIFAVGIDFLPTDHLGLAAAFSAPAGHGLKGMSVMIFCHFSLMQQDDRWLCRSAQNAFQAAA